MRTILFATLSLSASLALLQVSALPSPSPALIARDGSPTPVTLEARSPQPSNAKRGPRKRNQIPLSPEEQMSRHLCPSGMSVCPITSDSDLAANIIPFVPTTLLKWIEEGFECADFGSDLTSCGGCGSVNVRYDCTAVPNALGVSCVEGACRVHSCKAGFHLAADGKTCVRAH
ncbi:hypothetical protein BXZ70DRAFT_1010014 [Cristinia sonorae]|uniref:Protein CPL1-like domain-containing protein n=1 Tax=Cristinia sonorae TaxID=1940300 RepID=A0A8K0UJP6_9AGAR|nr:hypothetical protein BXZ70DRAFT_1010014 [Cristinia sonorae]